MIVPEDIAAHLLDIAFNSLEAGARRIGITLEENGEAVTLEITDDGCGMSPDVQALALSGPYTSSGAAGRGQGLPALRRRAESCGGFVRLTSSIGAGTRVTAHFARGAVIGDPEESVWLLIQTNPGVGIVYTRIRGTRRFTYDTASVPDCVRQPYLPAAEGLRIRDELRRLRDSLFS